MQTFFKRFEIDGAALPAGAPKDNLIRIIGKWTHKQEMTAAGGPAFKLDLAVVPGSDLGEGYEVKIAPDGARITSNHIRGIYAGVGALLRSCKVRDEGFVPTVGDGVSKPSKSIRGMYFATHFRNFYHVADINKVVEYVEDLSLTGLNTLIVWFDMHHFTGIDTPEAREMVDRLKTILKAAKSVAMGIGFTLLANEAYADSPVELRAEYAAQNGYRFLIEHFHLELCPSKPGGTEMILKLREEFFKTFEDVQPDILCIWPYDQGGCTCSACAPWGPNGFLRIAPPIAEMARKFFPDIKIILSCWDFDVMTENEWGKFKEAFSNEPKWVDYLLVEPREEYKEFPVKKGELFGLPTIGFPEISMMYCTPWGGFGANPLPYFLDNIWKVSGPLSDGGYAYSEGIFEDLNKYLISRMYWNGETDFRAAVRDYAAAFFTDEHADELTEAIMMSQRTLSRTRYEKGSNKPSYPYHQEHKGDGEGVRYVISKPENVDTIYEIVMRVDSLLRKPTARSWRWRLIYLRAAIDHELVHNDYNSNEKCFEYYRELTEIYDTPDADWFVRPPLPA